jgi:hypothetical protein
MILAKDEPSGVISTFGSMDMSEVTDASSSVTQDAQEEAEDISVGRLQLIPEHAQAEATSAAPPLEAANAHLHMYQ